MDWNLYGIPAIHQIYPEVNFLHRKLNTARIRKLLRLTLRLEVVHRKFGAHCNS